MAWAARGGWTSARRARSTSSGFDPICRGKRLISGALTGRVDGRYPGVGVQAVEIKLRVEPGDLGIFVGGSSAVEDRVTLTLVD